MLRTLRASVSALRTFASDDSLSKNIRTLQFGHSLEYPSRSRPALSRKVELHLVHLTFTESSNRRLSDIEKPSGAEGANNRARLALEVPMKGRERNVFGPMAFLISD
jgi:hypothetical protein